MDTAATNRNDARLLRLRPHQEWAVTPNAINKTNTSNLRSAELGFLAVVKTRVQTPRFCGLC